MLRLYGRSRRRRPFPRHKGGPEVSTVHWLCATRSSEPAVPCTARERFQTLYTQHDTTRAAHMLSLESGTSDEREHDNATIATRMRQYYSRHEDASRQRGGQHVPQLPSFLIYDAHRSYCLTAISQLRFSYIGTAPTQIQGQKLVIQPCRPLNTRRGLNRVQSYHPSHAAVHCSSASLTRAPRYII